jgi:asparagine synthetase B (glutamine-hydrolysing)
MKALFAMGVPARWNLNHVAGNSMMWHQGPAFEGIQALPPGSYATVTRDGAMKITKYYGRQPRSAGADDCMFMLRVSQHAHEMS